LARACAKPLQLGLQLRPELLVQHDPLGSLAHVLHPAALPPLPTQERELEGCLPSSASRRSAPRQRVRARVRRRLRPFEPLRLPLGSLALRRRRGNLDGCGFAPLRLKPADCAATTASTAAPALTDCSAAAAGTPSGDGGHDAAPRDDQHLGSELAPDRDVRGRPLVNADSSHRTAGENNAKWPEAGDRPCLEHFIRLLLRKHKYPLSRTFTSRRSDSNRGPLHYE
jgi:hypothetical protein